MIACDLPFEAWGNSSRCMVHNVMLPAALCRPTDTSCEASMLLVEC